MFLHHLAHPFQMYYVWNCTCIAQMLTETFSHSCILLWCMILLLLLKTCRKLLLQNSQPTRDEVHITGVILWFSVALTEREIPVLWFQYLMQNYCYPTNEYQTMSKRVWHTLFHCWFMLARVSSVECLKSFNCNISQKKNKDTSQTIFIRKLEQ